MAADVVLAPEIQVLAERVLMVERRIDDRFNVLKEQTALTLAANQKRLDGLNSFRQALSDQSARLMTRDEALSTIDAGREQINAQLEIMRAKMDSDSRPNWLVLIAICTMAFGLIGGFGPSCRCVSTPRPRRPCLGSVKSRRD